MELEILHSGITRRSCSFIIISVLILGGILLNECHQKPSTTEQSGKYGLIAGAIVRGDTTKKMMAIVFTGGDFGDGGDSIRKTLKSHGVKASFFFTGDFYRNPEFNRLTQSLLAGGHYLGAHSDKHLLYCDWTNRDSLLVTKDEFLSDLQANYYEMEKFSILPENAHYFMPPYEWYNDSISRWTKEAGYQLVNFTHGTLSNADYTTPDMPNYRTSDEIFDSITTYEKTSTCGLNGFILLIHIGTAPERTDKFYHRLNDLVLWLKQKNYSMVRIDELLR
jgi:peptidoglycan/xylan/chitin deacetylase (PgdA/CDA1 family)